MLTLDTMKKDTPIFILAGGFGTRISEETHLKPKPMIEIGGNPILLHIMKYYYSFGFNDFVICAGYKAWEIKDYFLNYPRKTRHVEIDYREGQKVTRSFGCEKEVEKWRVRVVDTGLETMTGARIKKAIDVISEDTEFENFAVTYGDGLCGVNLDDEFQFHLEHQKVGTVLGTSPANRFGVLDINDIGSVSSFMEKPKSEEHTDLINGGFFFFKRKFHEYLSDDLNCVLERKPLESLARDGQLIAYTKHKGFWQCMDTLRDKNHLQKLWDEGNAPWVQKRF